MASGTTRDEKWRVKEGKPNQPLVCSTIGTIPRQANGPAHPNQRTKLIKKNRIQAGYPYDDDVAKFGYNFKFKLRPYSVGETRSSPFID